MSRKFEKNISKFNNINVSTVNPFFTRANIGTELGLGAKGGKSINFFFF